MIIKKWDTTLNSGAGGWLAQSAKTNATDLVVDVTAGTPVSIFEVIGSTPKIKVAYLPNSVFDSLYFNGTIATNADLSDFSSEAVEDASSSGRSPLGYYWVATTGLTVSANTGAVLVGGKYYQTILNPAEEGTATSVSGVTIETGDWVVITKVTGDGSLSYPYVVTFATVNNTYETMTAASAGAGGASGLVPASSAGDQLKFLRADATWALPVTYSISTEASQESDEAFIRLTAGGSGSGTDDITLAVGTTGTSNTAGLTIEQASDVITFKHADTSSQASVSNSGRTYIQGITLDEFGHITAISSATETVTDTTYTAGNGISLSVGNQFSVAAGVGLTQEASGLKMTQPFISGTSTPSTGYQVANNIWFDLN